MGGQNLANFFGLGRQQGLATRVTALCVALVAATAFVLGIAFIGLSFRNAVADERAKALVFGRVTGQNAEPYLLLGDREALFRLARIAASDSAVSVCAFTDAEGRVLAVEPDSPETRTPLPPPDYGADRPAARLRDVSGGFTLVVPVIPRFDSPALRQDMGIESDDGPANPEILGYAVLEYSYDPLYEELRAQGLTTTLIALAVIGVALLVTGVVVRPFLRPIRDLVATTSAIANGDLTRRASEDAAGESGELARSFNHMAARLEESYAKIEDKVRARTRELAERTEDLEAEILHRTRTESELIKAKEAAEAASKAKSEFLANMSHELRTPLNGVIGMTELLIASDLPARQMHFAKTAKLSADTLLSLISDILDLSKVESGKLEIEQVEFNIIEAVESIAEVVSHKADFKKVELSSFIHPDIPPLVRGDPGRFQQVLLNLASNAMKFTESGEVTVTVLPERQTDSEVEVRVLVKDTGIGIPADRLDCLFRPFSQVDASTTRKYGGTGLGLRISKQLVQLMGGQVGVESAPGVGSTFWFTIPFDKVDGEAALCRRYKAIPAIQGLRVLIVDDNQTNCEILSHQLIAWGMMPDFVHSADQAMEALRSAGSNPYRLAILDMHMPHRDGADLGNAIRSDPKLRELPLIMLTSMTDEATFRRLREIGFSAMISKPAKQSRLFDAVLTAVDPGFATNLATEKKKPSWIDDEGTAIDKPILLVEDNRINQEVAASILEAAGFQVIIASNGAEALELLRENSFALILMDCHMPQMDGFEATARIRKAEAESSAPRIPIVALTANALRGDRAKCLDAGMDDYVPKPLDPAILVDTIRRLVGKAEYAASPALPTAAAPDSSGPAAAAFDLAGLRARCPGGPDVIIRVLKHFEEDAGRLIKVIAEAYATADLNAVAENAHALKGAAGNLSARAVSKAALALETSARSGEADALESLLASLRSQIEAAMAELPGVLEELSTTAAGPARSEAQRK